MQHHHVILTTRCLNNCKFCATGTLNHTLDKENVIEFLDVNDGDTVLLTGGSAELHKDFIEISKYIHDNGGTVEILTNSIKFADSKFTDAAAPYIDAAQCSFYSWSESITTYLTGNKKAYAKTTQGIKNLIDSSVAVEIKTLVNTRPVYRTLEMTVSKIISEFGLDTLWLSGTDYVGNVQINEGILVPLKRCRAQINRAIDLAISQGINVELMYLPLCLLTPRNVKLVSSCPGGSPISSYLSGDITWKAGEYDHEYGHECINCAHKGRCTGVWSKYMNLYNNGVI